MHFPGKVRNLSTLRTTVIWFPFPAQHHQNSVHQNFWENLSLLIFVVYVQHQILKAWPNVAEMATIVLTHPESLEEEAISGVLKTFQRG